MTLIKITSADAEKIARAFNDIISAKGLTAIRRRSVNAVGSDLRKSARVLAPAAYGTTAASLNIQGKAASPGSDNPKYVLRMASGFPVGKLRASLRKVTRKGGRQSLTIAPPHQDKQHFSAVERVGRAFRLLPAGPLPSRFIGNISTRTRRAFADPDDGGIAELAALRRKAEKSLPETVAQQITEHFKRRRN